MRLRSVRCRRSFPHGPRGRWPIREMPVALQNEIASALARDPRLAGSTIQVNVDDTAVTLEGRAAGDEEHLQAQRLAQSYAWNRKLVDHIAVDRAEAPRSK